jgi:26S proteasome regulatory subunit N9
MSGDRGAVAYLELEAKANPDQFSDLLTTSQKRLWHQVTEQLQSLDPWFNERDRLIQLHDNCVKHISKHLNLLAYTKFVVVASAQYPDAATAIAALETHIEETQDDAQASLVLHMAICRRKQALGELDECKKLLEKGQALADSYIGIMVPSVQATFFQASFEYFKEQGDAVQYYKNCLMFLNYTLLESLSQADKFQLAYDLSLASLIGDHTYNFGEVLQHPVLAALDVPEAKWLLDMMRACNAGDIGAFEKTLAAKKGAVKELADNEAFLQQKVRIMTLMESSFRRGGDQRTFTFAEIAEACELKVTMVEILLMRTFSLGVMKGSINQVEQKVRFTWVQPRVLELSQITELKKRLGEWAEGVDETTNYVINNARELVDLGPKFQ